MPDIPADGNGICTVHVVVSVAVEELVNHHNLSPTHGGAGSGKIYSTYVTGNWSS